MEPSKTKAKAQAMKEQVPDIVAAGALSQVFKLMVTCKSKAILAQCFKLCGSLALYRIACKQWMYARSFWVIVVDIVLLMTLYTFAVSRYGLQKAQGFHESLPAYLILSSKSFDSVLWITAFASRSLQVQAQCHQLGDLRCCKTNT